MEWKLSMTSKESMETWNIIATPNDNDRSCDNCKWGPVNDTHNCTEPNQFDSVGNTRYTCGGKYNDNGLQFAKWEWDGENR